MNLELYGKTEYHCDAVLREPIRIGEHNPDLDGLLQADRAAVFITAASPFDKLLTEKQNANRNGLFEILLKIKGLEYHHGVGAIPDGSWKPEDSFLVLNTDVDTGRMLAKEFQQHAFVLIPKGEPAELIIT